MLDLRPAKRRTNHLCHGPREGAAVLFTTTGPEFGVGAAVTKVEFTVVTAGPGCRPVTVTVAADDESAATPTDSDDRSDTVSAEADERSDIVSDITDDETAVLSAVADDETFTDSPTTGDEPTVLSSVIGDGSIIVSSLARYGSTVLSVVTSDKSDVPHFTSEDEPVVVAGAAGIESAGNHSAGHAHSGACIRRELGGSSFSSVTLSDASRMTETDGTQ